MSLADMTSAEISAWIITPLLIFSARMCDVGLGTLRIIMLSRGRKVIAPALGFVEIMIWLIAIRQIFQHLDNIAAFFAYAAGFSAGTAVGILIEEKLALGMVSIRVITTEDARDLVEELAASDFGVTSFAAEGVAGRVRLHFTIVRRKHLRRALDIIRQLHPTAFISVSDVRSVSEGVFPESSYRLRFPSFARKAK